MVKYNGTLTDLSLPTDFNGKDYGVWQYAFLNCTDLTSVTIVNGVTSIGDAAFYGSRLTSVTIVNGVTSIGDAAFYGSGLTSVTIADGVTSIGDSAFYGCTGLTSVTIPDCVTSIGARAFLFCPKLTSIYFFGTMAQWEAISKGSSWSIKSRAVIYCTDGETLS